MKEQNVKMYDGEMVRMLCLETLAEYFTNLLGSTPKPSRREGHTQDYLFFVNSVDDDVDVVDVVDVVTSSSSSSSYGV